jgi:hypothetical protein
MVGRGREDEVLLPLDNDKRAILILRVGGGSGERKLSQYV